MGVKLKEPPIVEVVCGFFFEPIEGLDPLLIGKLWSERSASYPKRELHPIVSDFAGPMLISQGVGPLRSFLISEDDAYVLQIQRDRLYFNWRKRSEAASYPSFNEHEGKPGVLGRSLDELRQFEAFCKRELEREVRVRRIELVKQDYLIQGKHLRGPDDLAKGLPIVAPLCAFAKSSNDLLFNVTVVDQREGADVRVQIATAQDLSREASGVQIQTRTTKGVSADVEADFRALNKVANDVFFELVHPDWFDRFGGVKA